MGTAVSKSAENIKEDCSDDNNIPSAPILTPQIRKLEWDPRSPSSDIARTPIEVLRTPITRSTETTTNNSPNIAVSDSNEHEPHIHVDPRSPTTEFHRTPIVCSEATMKLPSIHNKNLDNARIPLVAVTPGKPKKMLDRVSRKIYNPIEHVRVSPKLLESSPITVKPAENKRNSIVGLLETNMDFVETDLDVVIQNKIFNKMEISEDFNNSPFTVEPTEFSVADLSVTHQIRTSDVDQEDEIEKNLSPNNESTNSPKNILKESDFNIIHEIEGLELDSDDEAETDSNAVTPDLADLQQSVVGEISRKNSDSRDTKNGISVDELDKKLTNLIYEDKYSEVSPRPSKTVVNNRTPLGDRNSNSQQRRCIPVLKVSDKPTKSSVGISKIPVFREKKLRGKNVQCENTPPRMKPKNSQWSTEDSLII